MSEKFELEDDDAAVIFKKDGSFELAIPNSEEDADVPDHVMLCCAMGVVIRDENFKKQMIERFEEMVEKNKDEET